MTALRKRANAQELKYARDEERMFKAEARRNALIALWAAVAISHPNADDYAREIVSAGVEHPDQVIDRLHRDFDAAGVLFPEKDITARMASLLNDVADEMYMA